MICYYVDVSYFLFFFFQAEDGIRDLTVTGVQTCALPISADSERSEDVSRGYSGRHQDAGSREDPGAEAAGVPSVDQPGGRRSEERRVGKECRSRWWQQH